MLDLWKGSSPNAKFVLFKTWSWKPNWGGMAVIHLLSLGMIAIVCDFQGGLVMLEFLLDLVLSHKQ